MRLCHYKPLIFKHHSSHAAGDLEVDFMFEQDNAHYIIRGKHVDIIKVIKTLRRTQQNAIIN